MHIVASNGTQPCTQGWVLVKFKVLGSLRFLSHSETVNVFQRACIRAGIKLQYSEGFNPRPRLSLPLPRSVGVESDDELLCLRLAAIQSTSNTETRNSKPSLDTEQLKVELAKQLPNGIELLSVSTSKKKESFQPSAATYVLYIQPEHANKQLKTRIERILASESLNIDRQAHAKNTKSKSVDVRPFLKSVEFDNNRGIVIECKISSAGTIRVEEILKLLGLDTEKLAAPIRRTSVQWQANEL